jgi:cobalt-zinc-cadmium efflux system outer membrane protein
MKNRKHRMWLLLFLPVLMAGCAGMPKETGFKDVQLLVSDRADYRLQWIRGSDADRQVQEAIAKLLVDELTIDEAVQIALLNNRSLQATYEELGVTQADVVKAGLLKNPTFLGLVRFPEDSSEDTNLEFEVALDFLDILMLPARKKLAAAQFEQAKLRVSNQVLNLATTVEQAYIEAVGAIQIKRMRAQVSQASKNAFEFAQRLYKAGNISELGLNLQHAQYEQARLDLAASQNNIFTTREQLTRLMGLWGKHTAWQAKNQLSDIPKEEISLDRLESQAIANRFDLMVARHESEILAQALGITIDWRWLGSADIGVSAERDTDGGWVAGPSFSLELPIFDQHQADIARLESQLRQSHNRIYALAVDIRSEVRTLRDKLMMNRNLIEHYRGVIIPLRERIVALTMQKYNYMLADTFELLMAKQREYEDYQKYIETVRDYWITRAELQRTLGGRLPS